MLDRWATLIFYRDGEVALGPVVIPLPLVDSNSFLLVGISINGVTD